MTLINGFFVTLGAPGAVTAMAPAEAVLDNTGWRGLFVMLASATALCAAAIFLLVPDPATRTTGAAGPVGGILARRVERFERAAIVSCLFVMALTLCTAALGLGMAADQRGQGQGATNTGSAANNGDVHSLQRSRGQRSATPDQILTRPAAKTAS